MRVGVPAWAAALFPGVPGWAPRVAGHHGDAWPDAGGGCAGGAATGAEATRAACEAAEVGGAWTERLVVTQGTPLNLSWTTPFEHLTADVLVWRLYPFPPGFDAAEAGKCAFRITRRRYYSVC